MSKPILFIFLLLSMESLQKATPTPYFKELPVKELNDLLEKKHMLLDSAYQNEKNKASVSFFSDNTGIIFPGAGLGNGLYFSDLDEMKKMLQGTVFPVKGDGSFWEKEKLRVEDFENSMSFYCQQLTKMLNFQVELNLDTTYLKSLTSIITEKLKIKKKNYKLINYLSIYIAELIRLKSNATWKLLEVYTLNMYYIPEIVTAGKYCSPWSYIIDELEMSKYLPLDLTSLITKAGRFTTIGRRSYYQQ